MIATFTRLTCPVCGLEVGVSVNGIVRQHKPRRVRIDRHGKPEIYKGEGWCEGSGEFGEPIEPADSSVESTDSASAAMYITGFNTETGTIATYPVSGVQAR